jgi:GNAT superfamily N-acetyltransferase
MSAHLALLAVGALAVGGLRHGRSKGSRSAPTPPKLKWDLFPQEGEGGLEEHELGAEELLSDAAINTSREEVLVFVIVEKRTDKVLGALYASLPEGWGEGDDDGDQDEDEDEDEDDGEDEDEDEDKESRLTSCRESDDLNKRRFTVVVAPEARRRGLAHTLVSAFIESSEEISKERKCPLMLEAWVVNPFMAELLEGLDFDAESYRGWSQDSPFMTRWIG